LKRALVQQFKRAIACHRGARAQRGRPCDACSRRAGGKPHACGGLGNAAAPWAACFPTPQTPNPGQLTAPWSLTCFISLAIQAMSVCAVGGKKLSQGLGPRFGPPSAPGVRRTQGSNNSGPVRKDRCLPTNNPNAAITLLTEDGQFRGQSRGQSPRSNPRSTPRTSDSVESNERTAPSRVARRDGSWAIWALVAGQVRASSRPA
jgi:hypothetical protein